MKKLLKLIKRLVIFVVILGIVGGGWFYYNKYKTEKLKRMAEEERRKQEELEKERQRKILEERKKIYEGYLTQIEKYLKEEKNYAKVKELISEAIAFAKQYNFPTDKINQILHQIEVNNLLEKLKKLEKENGDIYKYFYVRNEVQKIPSFNEIIDFKNKIINQTYENEYKVKLISSKRALDNLAEGEQPSYNYFLSRKLYSDAKDLRIDRNIKKDKLEDEIEKLQNELYFASKSLYKNTIPTSLY